MTIAWFHGTLTGTAEGIAWQQAPNPQGTVALAAGGFVGNIQSNEPIESEAIPYCPMIGTSIEEDSATNSTFMLVGFAIPPGYQVRGHIWVVY